MPRIPLNMPKMSMTMEFGTVVEWEVDLGGPVRNGDAVVVVTTDKVDMDVEVTCDGTLVEILAQPGDHVPVGQPIAYIESEADDLLGDLFAAAPAASDASAEAPVQPSSHAAPGVSSAGGPSTAIRAVPLARRLAAEAELDLATVAASGPARTIRARDVRAALAVAQLEAGAPAPAAIAPAVPAATSAPAATAPSAPVPAAPTATAGADTTQASDVALLGDARTRRLRVATARVLEASALIPQFTAYRTFDLSRLAHARKASLKGIGWTTLLLRAYALTLREYPQLNGYWAGQGVRPNSHVGTSLAIDTQSGLLAPVIMNPDQMTVKILNSTIRQLAESVKDGKVDPASLEGGTGTVSNLGSMGVDRFNALLTPPQATALSLGAVGIRPVFDADGELHAQTACDAGLTIDHRVADGADAARALQTMQDFLSDPFALLA